MKKFLATTLIAFTISFFLCLNFVFANNMINNATDNAKNAVQSTGNAVENTAKGATGAIRNGINTVENAGKNTANNFKNGMQNTMNNVQNGTQNATNNDQNSDNITPSDSNYTAQRTAGETNNDFFGFMNDNIWAWIVIGIIAIAVIGIIWYYIATKNNYSNRNE